MRMEQNDQTKKGPEVSENALPEGGNDRAEGTPSGPHWKDLFKGIIQKILMASKTLGEKARHAYASIFKTDGDVGPLDDIRGAFRHIPFRKRGLKYLLVGALFTVYLLSGIYTVRPGEEAVARIFGKEVRHQIAEGLHYHLPWPFEAIEKVNVMEIRRVDVGVPSPQRPLLFPKSESTTQKPAMGGHSGHGGHGAQAGASKNPSPNPVSGKNQFLTGDENILEIRMIIQYRIKDASDYLFNVDSPDSLVPFTARTAVTELLGGMKVDNLLTIAKSQIQNRIARKTQKMLDEYGAGLQIVSVNLQEVNPPKEVAQAFRDVASAREAREETINKAQGYWNAVIPEARGKAHKTISDAEGYREEVINRASGDAEKFSAMLEEYRGAKGITEYRLYLETMEKILAKAKKFVIDSKKEQVNLKFVK
jgi:membrane protease subunit HflK